MSNGKISAKARPDAMFMPEPSVGQIEKWLFSLTNYYFAPQFHGLEMLDLERPALWVGNHTLYGLIDVPLMSYHLLQKHGVLLRSLGDRGHFEVPYWRDALVNRGMVLGTPENCSALMRSGQHVLVFPGGAREVWRRKGEAHTLIWKQRTGFARMAIEHGYDIIPFASLGVDDSLDILLDGNDIQASRLWRRLSSRLPLNRMTRDGELIPPLARGLGPSVIPRPQKLYFGFGPRITTAILRGDSGDKDIIWNVREQVALSIENQMDNLRAHREQDKRTNWGRVRRWLSD